MASSINMERKIWNDVSSSPIHFYFDFPLSIRYKKQHQDRIMFCLFNHILFAAVSWRMQLCLLSLLAVLQCVSGLAGITWKMKRSRRQKTGKMFIWKVILISSFRRHDVALSWMMQLVMLSWFTFRSAGIYSGYLVNHLQAFKKGGYPCLPLMGSHFSPGSARGAAFTPLVRSSWPAHAALTFCLTAHLANLRCHKPQVYECACVRVWEGWGRLLKKYLATYLQMKSTDGEKVRLSSSVAFVKFA